MPMYKGFAVWYMLVEDVPWIYHDMVHDMVHVMVYVAQTYTVAEILCASVFRCIDGIWVHVSLKFFGNSQWLVI